MLQTIAWNSIICICAAAIVLLEGLPPYLLVAIFALPLVVGLVGRWHGLDILWRVMLPFLLGIGAIYLYRGLHQIHWLKENFLSLPVNPSYGEQYFSVMATLYAVTTALMLVKAIESFDRLNSTVIEEANKVRSIAEFLFYFHTPVRDGNTVLVEHLRALLRKYVDGARAEPRLAGGNGGVKYLDACARDVSRLTCADENDRIALSEIIKALNELFSLRARRIGYSKAKMPIYLIGMLAGMSLSMLLLFMLEPPDKITHNYTMIFTLTVFSTFIVILLEDINDPFDGFWVADLSPYEDVSRFIAESSEAAAMAEGTPARAA